MHVIRILLFTMALVASSISLAQEETMLAKHGIIPDLPKEFTDRGEVIVIMNDREGKPLVVSYVRCPRSDTAEIAWWRQGDVYAIQISCTGETTLVDVRGKPLWIVPVPLRR